ncbi:helix-turn-helix domain-containing protein [Fictibacillus phosphorivorans]|uniref:helix-turn-helix domain-containing protein n=1 Tax=Fictibacillus phosphorivorans TaxID=1221500 RepID=UPI0035E49679
MSKKKILIIASEETFNNLKSFNDIAELNESVRKHKEQNALNKSAKAVLDLLHRYSAKHTGVSFLSKNTIATILRCSKRTVIRACQLLEALGIIKQLPMKRKSDMLQTSNAIVIQPVCKVHDELHNETMVQDEPEFVTQVGNDISPKMSPQENHSSSLKPNIINKRNNNQLTSEFCSEKIPQTFVKYASIINDSLNFVEKLWSKVQLAAWKNSCEHQIDQVETISIQSIKQLIRKIKVAKVRDKHAYFYSVLNAKMEDLYFEDLEQLRL